MHTAVCYPLTWVLLGLSVLERLLFALAVLAIHQAAAASAAPSHPDSFRVFSEV